MAIRTVPSAVLSDSIKQEFALNLLRSGAFKVEPTLLKNGSVSLIYTDLRMLPSCPSAMVQSCSILSRQIRAVDGIDRCAPVPYGAYIYTGMISAITSIPIILPRKEAKKHGSQELIDGIYAKGDKVALYDDVLNDGGSKYECIEILQNEGLEVVGICVLVDRENPKSQKLRERYPVYAAITLREILAILVEEQSISPEKHNQILKELYSGNR
jgi:orotate phosphoribosyltransferase